VEGKYAPFPERYGGLGNQAKPTIRVLADALGKARGTAYDTTEGGTVEVRDWGVARALWEGWETNDRLARVTDVRRVAGAMLGRWEAILAKPPEPGDTIVARQSRLVDIQRREGQTPHQQYVLDRLTELLGDILVQVHHIAPADAVMYWPGGTELPGYPWYSTVCYLPVQVQRPTGFTWPDFFGRIGKLAALLDDILPAWITFDWFLTEGFILDEENNLDGAAFDE
jgi:hypothetical protein